MASKQKRNKNKNSHSGRGERRYTVRGIRRDPVDLPKLGKALIGLAMAEAEREAQAEQAARNAKSNVASAGEEQSGGAQDG